MKIRTGFACGRGYLEVNGFVVAMEGDMVRDSEIPSTHWNEESFQMVIKGQVPKRPEPQFQSLSEYNAESKYFAEKQRQREEHDTFCNQKLKETAVTVEANSYEHMKLWAEVNDKNGYLNERYGWVEERRGMYEQIGEFIVNKQKYPVILSARWAMIYPKKIGPVAGKTFMFWELTSRFTDSEMAEKYLRDLPNAKTHVNATNFHNGLAIFRD